jgi:hypothetical protein
MRGRPLSAELFDVDHPKPPIIFPTAVVANDGSLDGALVDPELGGRNFHRHKTLRSSGRCRSASLQQHLIELHVDGVVRSTTSFGN